MAVRREKRLYSEEFKQQVVQLYNAGKPRFEIIRDYDLTPSALGGWIRRINSSGSSRVVDNRSEQDIQILTLQKENKQLKMENDILKQAALILAQK